MKVKRCDMRRGQEGIDACVLYNLDMNKPMTTNSIIDGGVTTQYDQKIVLLMSRSNASPDAACVICASVSAGGDAISSTFDTTNTGL